MSTNESLSYLHPRSIAHLAGHVQALLETRLWLEVGIPVGAIALILGVDRSLDMCCTTVNVTGDLTASVVMNCWVGGGLTAEQERAARDERDARRAVSGEDVIVDDRLAPEI